MNDSIKDHALHYGRLGLAVFPIRPRSKQPLTEHGFKDASKDPQQIEKWWSRWPDANIGIATGSVSGGLVVIDLDVDKDKGIDGRATLRDWEAQYGKLPDKTWLSITGRGGYHYFYHDTSVVKNRTNIYEGIDIRGDGGYVVAPPSVHPNGRTYEWEQDPILYPLADADNTVINFLLGPVPENWERKPLELPDQIPDGERTTAMVKLVCSQQAKGLSDEAIRAAVRAENEQKCIPPLTDQELEKEVFPALKRYQKGTAPYQGKDFSRRSNWNAQAPGENPGLTVICLDDIEEQEIEWIWKPRIPKAKITLVQGAPGCSKTTLLCRIIADMTTGRPFLGEIDAYDDDNPFTQRGPLNVLYQITEDDFSDTIKKRLRIAGADMTRIFNIDESKKPLTFADPRIKEAIEKWNIDVVVFDPLMSYVGADVQLNVGNSARDIMTHLILLGKETGCTFIVAAHTSKQTSAEAINRLIGSIDFISSARSVLTVGRNPNCESQKALAQTKSNLGMLAPTIMYRLDYDDGLVKFDGFSSLTDNEIIAPKEPRGKGSPATEDAKAFLLELLADGYATSKEVQDSAKIAGISAGTLQKAKDELKIITKHYKGDTRLLYWWIMPGREVPEYIRQSRNAEKVEKSK